MIKPIVLLISLIGAPAFADNVVAKYTNPDLFEITTQKVRLQLQDGSAILEDGRVLKAGTYVINIPFQPGDINPGVIVQYERIRKISRWDSDTKKNQVLAIRDLAADHIKHVFTDGSVELENGVKLNRDQYNLPVKQSGPIKAGLYVKYLADISRTLGPNGIETEKGPMVSQVMRVFPNYALLINHDVIPLNAMRVVDACEAIASSNSKKN